MTDRNESPPLSPNDRAIPVPSDALRHIAQVAPEAAAQLLDALCVLQLHGGWPGLWAASCAAILDHRHKRVHPVFDDPEQQRRAEAIAFARANVGLSGYHPTAEDDEIDRRFINGELTVEEIISDMLNQKPEKTLPGAA